MRVGAKVVSISAAVGILLNEHVDIYECENVFALINNPIGEYRVLEYSPGSARKNINSRPLVRYFRDKCGCNSSFRMSAWVDREIIFFCYGYPGKNTRFHAGFSMVTVLRMQDVLRVVREMI